MIFPSRFLGGFRSFTPGPIPFQAVDGRLRGLVCWAELDPFIDAGIVEGRGTRAALKVVRLTVDDDEAERAIREKARDVVRERARRPLEILHRYCSDRKTTFREKVSVQAGGRVTFIFQHKHLQFA